MKLLLAEDTHDLNAAIAAMLGINGYEVTSVYDGAAALADLEDNTYDGIILDIMMPKLDGLQVLQALRARGVVTPVLMLTAKAEIEDRVQGLNLGADDYLTKPFAMKELVARVNAMTRRRTEYTPEDIRLGNMTLRSGTQELSAENSIRLSMKEMELLQTLLLNQDKDIENTYLLERVFADTEGATADNVWLYINYLRAKMTSINANVEISGDQKGPYRIHVRTSD